jgi:hypothetical protein
MRERWQGEEARELGERGSLSRGLV